MRINNNLVVMNTHRQLGISIIAGSKSMEKLSSGLRINRAADDAAGLSISEKMRGQIRGLNQASRNAQDGISLIQTAEGALDEVHAILGRIRELVIQAGNEGALQQEDMDAIDAEYRQLVKELDGIAEKTEFNGKKLLDGSYKGVLHIGANKGQMLELKIDTTEDLDLSENIMKRMFRISTEFETSGKGVSAEDLGVHDLEFKLKTPETEGDINNDLNENESIDKDPVDENEGKGPVDENEGKDPVDENEVKDPVDENEGKGPVDENEGKDPVDENEGKDPVDENEGKDPVDKDKGKCPINKGKGKGPVNKGKGKCSKGKNKGKGKNKEKGKDKVHNKPNCKHPPIRSTSLTMRTMVDVSVFEETEVKGPETKTQADRNLGKVDKAVKIVSRLRSNLGASQNRLEHTIKNLDNGAENLQAAESRIRDVDMAKEMMEQTKQNILQQASTVMLAQANMVPQIVLQLLG